LDWSGVSAGKAGPCLGQAENFAKSLLVTAYGKCPRTITAVGGVVSFSIRLTEDKSRLLFENLKQWQSGSLAEASFWKARSVDPPEMSIDKSESAFKTHSSHGIL